MPGRDKSKANTTTTVTIGIYLCQGPRSFAYLSIHSSLRSFPLPSSALGVGTRDSAVGTLSLLECNLLAR